MDKIPPLASPYNIGTMRQFVLIIFTIGTWAVLVPQALGQPDHRIPQGKSFSSTQVPTKAGQNQAADSDAIKGITTQLAQVQQRQTEILKAQADQANDEAKIDGKLTNYTGLLVLVGAVQALILAATIFTIIQQTLTIRNSERAWIGVRIDAVQEPTPVDLAIVITPTVKNYGKTAARIVKFCLHYVLLQSPEALDAKPDYPKERTAEASFVVPSNAPMQPMAVGIAQPDFQEVIDARKFLYVYGYIDYVILEKHRRQTRFCLMYYPKLASFGPLKPGFYVGIQAPEAYKKCT